MSNYSFSYKGTDFGGSNYKVAVVGADHQRMPKPRLNVDDYAQSDGAVFQGSTYGPRTITLQCAMTATTEANRATQMDNLIAALGLTQEGGGNLTIDMFPDKIFTGARLVSDLTASVHARMEEFTVVFVADSWPAAASATSLGDTANSGTGTTSI